MTVAPRRLFLASAGGVTLWLMLTMLWHFTFGHGRELAHIFFLAQDLPALLLAIAGLILLSPFGNQGGGNLPAPAGRIIIPLVLFFCLWSWAGHYLVLQDYALSRDEEVADFAGAYMREGLLGRPIPPEWMTMRRAIMPEFFSPFGADHYWASNYLPVNSAIRALFWRLGDPNLAGPVLLGIGLISLWRIAVRLFPDRSDAVWVVMLMALTSAQLSVTAMTPFAMTGHFAFNMLWLALFLHGGWRGHVGAGLVMLLTGGLHQWHFPLLFLLPFLGWMLLRGRFGALLFHGGIAVLLVLLWARLWPAMLMTHLGPPADILPPAGVQAKVHSLFARLERWQPLFNLSRLLSWNNILMAPLAILGSAWADWSAKSRGAGIALPLALGCLIGCALALFQGYGWGYRYGQGFIGSFCLLAGFGWLKIRSVSLRPIFLGSGLALLTGAFLTERAYHYVAPYAAVHRLIHRVPFDVILIDARGGLFVTDLVRTDHGSNRRPVILNMGMLASHDIATLCAGKRVGILDRTTFIPMGVPVARFTAYPNELVRQQLNAMHCGVVIAR